MSLARASWEVLKADKELVALPLISFVVLLAVLASFAVPMVLSGDTTALEDQSTTALAVLGIVFYLAAAFVTIFFNAALVHAANERLDGGDPTIGSAISGAARRIGGIFVWSLVSATVSMILRSIQERSGLLGRIVAGIAGIAWALVTFLVLPVLVIEGIGVGEAIRRSGRLFKQTWGENVAAQVGFGLLGFLLALPAMLLAAGAFAIGQQIGLIVLGLAVLWMLTVSLVLTALNGIFQTALYRYAVGAEGTGYFTEADMRHAFAGKGGRSLMPPGFSGGIGGGSSDDHWEAPPGSWSSPAGSWDKPDDDQPKPADPWEGAR
jgi:hypothetical protein